MLRVIYPPSYAPEREYILRVVLGDWLGLEFVAEGGEVGCVEISRMEDPGGGRLEIMDAFFLTPREEWLTGASLPPAIQTWRPTPGIPRIPATLALLFGSRLENGDYVSVRPGLVRLGIDVLGSAFFMLTRYEEVVNSQRDEFDRFAGRFSILHSSGLLERPIVNEWVELLWWALQQLWPDLVRRPRAYRCLVSCDIDLIDVLGASLRRAFRVVAGRAVRDALRDGPWHSAFQRAGRLWKAWRGHPGADQLDDFDVLMDQAEQVSCRIAFNFLAGHGPSGWDGTYGVHRHGMRRLMRRIADRGHELGFHGSYDTYLDPGRLRQEFARLTRIATEEGVTQAQWGGRQHFLRWAAPTTWQAYEDAGIAYDSTLGYADLSGFRCGACYDFPVFNLQTCRVLNLRERPLIVMEKTIFKYMGLTGTQAVEKVATLSQVCRAFRGDFTLLWHNGQTGAPEMREMYVQMLRAAASGTAGPRAGAPR
jgi:hypothetical protein